MLTAIRTDTQERVFASQVERAAGPFACGFCRQPVALRKSDLRIHHFAHHPKSACICARGETPRHREVKEAIYNALSALGIEADLECGLERRRADIFFRYRGRDIAVEVQRSRITIEEMIQRTRDHSKASCATVWVLTDPPPVSGERLRVPAWVRELHRLYFGVVFYHYRADLLQPCALLNSTRIVPEREFPDREHRGLRTAGGYATKYCGVKRALLAPAPVAVSELVVRVREPGMFLACLSYAKSEFRRRRHPQQDFRLEMAAGFATLTLTSEREIEALIADRDFLTDQTIRVTYEGTTTDRLVALIQQASKRRIEVRIDWPDTES